MKMCLGILLVLAGCATGDAPNPETPDLGPQPAPDTTTVYYDASGVVRNITPSRSHFVVRHGNIEGFMNAMTMPFELHPDSSFDTIEIGDSITFRLKATPGKSLQMIAAETVSPTG